MRDVSLTECCNLCSLPARGRRQCRRRPPIQSLHRCGPHLGPPLGKVHSVTHVDAVLDTAGVKNSKVREYVRYWADLTGAERVEVVSAGDDARLIQEALEAGELEPAGEGRYYSRSYHKDTARSEERTIVATSDPADKGVYNNWRPASEMKPLLVDRMRGASVGKTMYVIPYLMSPPGNALAPWAASCCRRPYRPGHWSPRSCAPRSARCPYGNCGSSSGPRLPARAPRPPVPPG